MAILRRVLVLAAMAALFSVGLVQAQDSGVSDARFARLAKGVNLPFRFWYGPSGDASIRARLTEADFELLHNLGFTHVRLPIDPNWLLIDAATSLLHPRRLALVDETIVNLVAHDLAVIVDIHTTDEKNLPGALNRFLQESTDSYDLFKKFWAELALHLSATDPEWVFLEPLNEPIFYDEQATWFDLQPELIAVIRANAPEHTILATANRWSSRTTLLELTPLADPNIVYNFHFYEPFWFTHQGATWGGEEVKSLRDIPYPSSPEAVAPILDNIADFTVRGYIEYYGQERWNKTLIDTLFSEVQAWATAHNVRVTCNEFGVYGAFADPTARINWLRDVRSGLESANIGWTLWEYDGNFGFVSRETGKLSVEDAVVAALGLHSEGLPK